jgi:hypothetical protein
LAVARGFGFALLRGADFFAFGLRVEAERAVGLLAAFFFGAGRFDTAFLFIAALRDFALAFFAAMDPPLPTALRVIGIVRESTAVASPPAPWMRLQCQF